MKKTSPFYILFLLLVTVSCSKKNDGTQNPTVNFSFFANRAEFIIPSGNFNYLQNPGLAQPRVRPAGSGFYLTASENSSGNSVQFTGFIKADKLEVGTYDAAMYFKSGFSAFDSSINSSVVITKIANGQASGTFYGTIYSVLYSVINDAPVVITNGKFENIKIQN